MKITTSQKIIEIIRQKGQVRPKELINILEINERAIFKQLNKLFGLGVIAKAGKPPRVYYYLPDKAKLKETTPNIKSQIIEENYLIITPVGEKLKGISGFEYWCQKNNLPLLKTAREYESTFGKYQQYKKSGLIDGMYKLKHTFKQVYLDRLYYLDFYSIERFGKTRLGWLLLYAKQSQNRLLVKEIIEEIKDKVKKIILANKIDAIGFIPPTVKRDIQLMNELSDNLNFSLPLINFQKIKTPIIIPQKTLSKLEDRIENAQKSIFLDEERVFDNILLIDDAVGSGATINEAARKIRQKQIAKGKIIGLAITGSFKGFEVISEL